MRAGRKIGVRPRSRGFTYLSLLLIVAALGTGMAAFGELASHAAQREKEAELLFIGDAYREATYLLTEADRLEPNNNQTLYRLAQMRNAISDMRVVNDNDIRFISQF